MQIFPVADHHSDDRRDLTAFRPPPEFPRAAEAKVLVTKKAEVRLGNHSHPHFEGFFLVAGSCTVRTWTPTGGVQEQSLSAPIMFMFEPNEEHLLTCSEGMVIVGYMPVTFEEERNVPAQHLS
ncbi:hypothetical protein HY635_01010 [Candidatus Uhrbacteria bacterium]|nr:hypothetical protein [Candidatus Uhrbacteria bacterium]